MTIHCERCGKLIEPSSHFHKIRDEHSDTGEVRYMEVCPTCADAWYDHARLGETVPEL